ncbi:DNA cytosine methyltransferase [Candidatus Peregrinibacteria bacterium]|jgi:DNA (cytosine-5)-methyltransferase 1|nr:DNA cytosine methyltransferase [Candidatus Peregrinibacteria bacterium]
MKKKKFTFIDLFAGIGGFHLAFHNVGAKCVFACEWDEPARKTYRHNFEKISPNVFKGGNFVGDINSIKDVNKEIPDFDILTAGFPCQPFSQAGRKKGFEDTRGTLFFNIAEILKVKQPEAFFLENVRGLLKHDDGKTFEKIKSTLEGELEYSFKHFIVKASDYGLPQLRPRLFMIGFKDKSIDFKQPETVPLKLTMSDVWKGKCTRDIGFTLRVGGARSGIHDRRNWDGYLVDGEVKLLSPEEGRQMQGFPDNFEFPVSKAEAMKQLGNSVAVSAIQAFAGNIVEALKLSHAKLPLEKRLHSDIQPKERVKGVSQGNKRPVLAPQLS